ncbi:MAG: hypothetical protein QHH05_07790 [Syntrophomonadaceae bacterium]|nr:hypothetical protein [Syntrophomonadaceae bacterium]
METGRVEVVKELVIGLRPVYTETGNDTELWLEDGRVLLDRRGLRAVVKALARSFALDLVAQRERVRELLGQTGLVPLCVGGRVLVPLRMRESRCEHDAAYGYLDAGQVREVEARAGGGCLVRLACGSQVEVRSTRATVLKSLDNARRLQGGEAEAGSEEQVVQAVRCLLGMLAGMERSLAELSRRLDGGQ